MEDFFIYFFLGTWKGKTGEERVKASIC